ncbi:MAG: hypothetical protein AB1589_11200 [Cyanobacteriota bacterium]
MKHYRDDRRSYLPFWSRIPYEAKLGALAVVAMGIAMVVFNEPSPSAKNQKSSSEKTALQPEAMSPLGVPTPPQEGLPSPVTSLPQLPPELEGLGKDPLTSSLPPLPQGPVIDPLSPSVPQKSIDLPLSVSPSPVKIPTKGTPSTRELSPLEITPIPSSLPSPLQTLPLPSESIASQEVPQAGTTQKNNNSSKSSSVEAEVRNYFQKGWKPPSGLNESLNYSVLLNADGTIEQILPLSNAAGEYIDSTNIPKPGGSLVSGTDGGGKTRVNVEFSPDGKVKTSVEEANLPSSSPSSPREGSSNSLGREARP